MEIRIAIVDDAKDDREDLEKRVRLYFKPLQPDTICSVDCFPDGTSLLSSYESGIYSIAFLDICMEEMNGIELARKLRSSDPRLLIIFISTSREYAFDAFPIHPFEYLVKPFETERLYHVLQEALIVLDASDRKILIRAARNEYQVPLSKIISLTASGHSVDLRLSDGQFLRSIQTFAELRNTLEKDPRFLPCNRGVLINMDYVLTRDGDTMQMKDGSVFPIRIRGRAELLTKFSQYMISKL